MAVEEEKEEKGFAVHEVEASSKRGRDCISRCGGGLLLSEHSSGGEAWWGRRTEVGLCGFRYSLRRGQNRAVWCK